MESDDDDGGELKRRNIGNSESILKSYTPEEKMDSDDGGDD